MIKGWNEFDKFNNPTNFSTLILTCKKTIEILKDEKEALYKSKNLILKNK